MTNQTYTAVSHHVAHGIMRHSVREAGTGRTVDVALTASGAEYRARMLNVGACTVDEHLPLGTRVVPAADAERI